MMNVKNIDFARLTVSWIVVTTLFSAGAAAVEEASVNSAYPEGFAGTIGKTLSDSVADWPNPVAAPSGSPNVVVWLLDDAGFAHLSPYGGLTDTPNIADLARNGLVYTNFHSVPLCSPARAALLHGRNHHSIAMGSHIMSPAGFPGYHGQIPKSAASIGKILRDIGYATFAVGKWDQTPITEASVAGPFDRWPSGQGFDRFYGFLGAEANHFEPALWSDHTPISPAAASEDYFLTEDLADRAIDFVAGLRATSPKKPFFLYFATGAVHSPHHAPSEMIEKYDSVYEIGWDKTREKILEYQKREKIAPTTTELSQPHPEIPRWADVPPAEQRLYARQMAAFAGQLEHADLHFGRIVNLLRDLGELDNTIIIVTSDNGASAEGGMAGLHNGALAINSKTADFESNNRFYDAWGSASTNNHFHAGWGMAGNTPFPFFKHHVDAGGTQVPLIIHWPERIKNSGKRHQFHHIIDIVPTLLAGIGIEPPSVVDGVEQQPFDGLSMTYSFDDFEVPSRREVQYFEVWGNRGIYKDGWRAATIHNNIMPWERPIPGSLSEDSWRLYHVSEDFSYSKNLAESNPGKLKELQSAWIDEAEKYGVFPLDPDRRSRTRAQINKSGRKENVIRYSRRGSQRIPESLSPPVKNRSFSVTASITTVNGETANGVIATSGGLSGGYSLYIMDGTPIYVLNLYNEERVYVKSNKKIPSGDVEIRFDFRKNAADNGGVGSLFIGDSLVGTSRFAETTNNIYAVEEGFDIGRDEGSAVTPDYVPPFRFSGEIHDVTFELR